MSADPTTWGVQDNGFYAPTAAEIKECLEAQQRAYVSPDIDVDGDSVQGQYNGIFAAQLALAWEAVGALEAARTRGGAEGAMLDEIGMLTGSSRDAARPTIVPCNCVLTSGTTLTRDKLASVVGRPDLTFYPVVDASLGFTATSTGTYQISFACSQAGPIVIGTATLTVIATPVSGWTSVTNTSSGTVGSTVASDTDFRTEQELDLTASGTATAAAIEASLPYDEGTGAGVAGVLSATVLENYTDVTDANGVPARHIEVILYTDGTETPNDVATKIFEEKPAGCATYGSSHGYYVDQNNETHTVYYTLVDDVQIFIRYSLTTSTGYVGGAAVKDFVVEEATKRHKAGMTVNYVWLKALPLHLAGVTDVTACYVGRTFPPGLEENIEITSRELATFSALGIQVNGA